MLTTHRPFGETIGLLAAHCDVAVNRTSDTLTPEDVRTQGSATTTARRAIERRAAESLLQVLVP